MKDVDMFLSWNFGIHVICFFSCASRMDELILSIFVDDWSVIVDTGIASSLSQHFDCVWGAL